MQPHGRARAWHTEVLGSIPTQREKKTRKKQEKMTASYTNKTEERGTTAAPRALPGH